MNKEELTQLRKMLVQFAEWDCEYENCDECPMLYNDEHGRKLCGDIYASLEYHKVVE